MIGTGHRLGSMGALRLPALAVLISTAVPVLAAPPSPRPSPTMPAGAQAMSGTFHPAAAVQRAVEAWNAADLSYFEAAMDPVVTVVLPDRVARGREDALDALAAPMDARLHVEATRVLAGTRGDTAWASFRFTLEQGADVVHAGSGAVVFVRQEGVWRTLLVHLAEDAKP
jgi:hypothetical protein